MLSRLPREVYSDSSAETQIPDLDLMDGLQGLGPGFGDF